MSDDADAFSIEKEKYESEKDRIIKEEGWESPKLEELYASFKPLKEEMEKKYTSGMWKAFRCWFWSLREDKEDVIFDDFCWDKEVADFIQTFVEAGIESFIYTNHSSAVMDNIHGFIKAGCYVDSYPVLERDSDLLTRKETEYINGIKFIVPKMKTEV